MTMTMLPPRPLAERGLEAVDELLTFARKRLAKARQATRDELIARHLGSFAGDLSGYFAAFAERALPTVRKTTAYTWDPDADVDWDLEADELGKVFLRWYTTFGVAGYDAVSEEIGVDLAWEVDGSIPGWVKDTVGRRVKGITETTRDTIRGYVERAIADGSSMDALSRQLSDVVDAWGASGGRAGVIALSESATAYNLSSVNGYRDSGLVDTVTVLDGAECVMPDTQFVPYGGLIGMMRAWFSGNAYRLTVRTPSGSEQLTVGPNHPVLTGRGWQPAHLIREGDQVVHDSRLRDPKTLALVDLDEVPTIQDVFESLRATRPLRLREVMPVEFHGDGASCQGEVEAVGAAGSLLFEGDPAGLQKLAKLALMLADPGLSVVASARGKGELRFRLGSSPGGSVGSESPGLSFFDREPRGDAPSRLGSWSGKAERADVAIDDTRRALQFASDRRAAHAIEVQPLDRVAVDPRARVIGASTRTETALGVVVRPEHSAALLAGHGNWPSLVEFAHGLFLAPVIDVSVSPYQGWVYDASTRDGLYSANCTPVANCGWDGHDDDDLANGSTRTLDEAEETPTSHPSCQRSFAPNVEGDS